MAKVITDKPDHLTMRLFAPGMSLLHRAGLGGLACTLKAMERQYEAGLLAKSKLPTPFDGDTPPWEIGKESLTLRFGKAEKAGDYLKRLFAFAFQVRSKDGLIYLPGQYGDVPPPLEVLASLQDGIQNTFLQHGPTCGSRSGERTAVVEINETPISVTHDVFTSYKHQGWFWLDRDEKSKEKDPKTGKKLKTGRRVQNHQDFPAVSDDGTLSNALHEIDNKLSPGAIVRHDRFDASAVRETDAGLICLHFALIGCLALSINRVTAALLVPEVIDLLDFAESRRWLTPQTAIECRIAGTADAALQSQVRLRARRTASDSTIPGCYGMTCKPTQWNKKQKPRVATIHISIGADRVLDRFERVLGLLPPRLVIPRPPESTSRGKKAIKKQEPFWTDSMIRPLIAENLTVDRYWYDQFERLCQTKERWKQMIKYERKGLQVMAKDTVLTDTDEAAFVAAVHRAIYMGRGRIYSETMGADAAKRRLPANPATEKRWDRFMERLRLGLVGAKTANQVQSVVNELLARYGVVKELRDSETVALVRRMIFGADWQRARNLALFALASYQRPPTVDPIPGDNVAEPETTPTTR